MSAFITIKITIPNWEKFNPRSDRANYSWFRMENKFFKSTFSLPEPAKITFLFILCEASQKNSGDIELGLDYAAALLKRSNVQLAKDIDLLIECGFVAAESRHDDGEEPALLPATRRNGTIRDERNETNTHNGGLFDFEAIYQEYPKHLGKKKGIERCKSRIRTQGQYDALQRAVGIYKARVAGTDPQFIKQFDSFMSVWEDYTDLDTTTLPVAAQEDVKKREMEAELERMRIETAELQEKARIEWEAEFRVAK